MPMMSDILLGLAVVGVGAFEIDDKAVVRSLHAQGAQIYECRPGKDGTLSWEFREPIAVLIDGERTVGYHARGPRWVLDDGEMLVGKVSERRSGRTPADIPELKLDVTERRGKQPFGQSKIILRVDTVGGMLQGVCDKPGTLHAEPYSAQYLFLSR